MNLSIIDMGSVEISLGADARLRNAFVTSGQVSLTAHAVFLATSCKY